MERFLRVGRCRSQDPDSPRRRTQQTFDRFVTATKRRAPSVVPLLLVDSEEAVASHSVWQHLRSRDRWNTPAGARDDQAFLMVQAMETWLLADIVALRRYFGTRLRQSALKQWPRPQSDCDRGASKSDRGMRQALPKAGSRSSCSRQLILPASKPPAVTPRRSWIVSGRCNRI